MINLKSEKQIELMREAGKVTRDVLLYIEQFIKPGVSTKQLDELCEDFIRKNGAIPSCKGYSGYPASICASVNDVIVHGIPSGKIILKEGDIISVDVVCFKRGYHGDATRTFPVGKISAENQKLIDVTKQSFFEGLKDIKIGNTIGDISYQIQKYVESNGFSVIREMVGHGIGTEMHEDPSVPNYGHKGFGPKIEKGLVIAVEPMVNMGRKEIVVDRDGWTCRTRDHKPSAHYENTIVFTENGIEILTL